MRYMMSTQRMRQGTLLLDQYNRYYICEPEQPVSSITLTSGCAVEVLLGSTWISGHVEGDGQDYWFYVQTGGKFKLAEGMVVRYTELASVPCGSV